MKSLIAVFFFFAQAILCSGQTVRDNILTYKTAYDKDENLLSWDKPEKWNGWSYHDVETDANGILPWHDPAHLGRSYDHVLDLVWNYWINLPTMPNGYKYYVQFRIANAPDNRKGAQEGGLGGDQNRHAHVVMASLLCLYRQP